MADVNPTNTSTTEGGKVTTFMPKASPVVDEEGKEIENPNDALERQRELFKETEKAEKAEAEKAEKAAKEEAEAVDEEDDEEETKQDAEKSVRAAKTAKEDKAHPETKMEKLEAPKDTKVAVNKPAKAADAGNKAEATEKTAAGEKEVKN